MTTAKQKWFFLRGLVRESGHWAGFLEKFQSHFPQVEIVPIDLPGSGVHFQKTCPSSVPGMVDELRKEFLSAGSTNHLFAISLGAMVGLDWMHRYPQDFQSAILVNTSLRGISPLYHRLLPRNYFTILKCFFSSPLEIEKNILRITSNRPELHAALALEWEKIHRSRPVSKSNAIRQLWAAAKFHPPQEKPRTKILLLNSLEDHLVSPDCSRALADFWKVPLQRHPSAGHDLTLDEPQWVLEQSQEFLHKNG